MAPPPNNDQGISLRQAALTAGFGLLIMTVAAPFAEFYVLPRLVIPGDITATVQNIGVDKLLYLAGVFANLITYICDVFVAWALYVLLISTHRSLSLLTAWFRLVYTVIALVSLLKLATVFRLVNTPDHLAVLGADQLHAQVHLLLSSSRYEWGFGLMLFGVHLVLLGYLVFRADFIPRVMGILVAIAGAGYLIFNLGRYFYPEIDLGIVAITFLGEPVFMFWLLIKGWTLKELPS